MSPIGPKAARLRIVEYIEALHRRVFGRRELRMLIGKQWASWGLTNSIDIEDLIEELIQRAALKAASVRLPGGGTVRRYIWSEASPYEVALSLRPSSYLSHYTALHINGLTEKVPKTIYVNKEQSSRGAWAAELDQAAVNRAMARPVRVTRNVADYDGRKIFLLNGKCTGQLGVVEVDAGEGHGVLRVTDEERTLVDCAVRPIYAGGVFQVLDAFRAARGRISGNRLAATLSKMDFVYPYHQVIGFYLERAGYPLRTLELFLRFETKLDFYLTHGMKSCDYSERWRLHHPEGMG